MQTFKQIAIKAAKEAGRIQLRNYGKIKNIRDKGEIGLVTNVDIECEKKIVEIIKKKFPQHNILAEEHLYPSADSDFKWLIDPLDGTHNYIYALHMFGVSIALEYKKQIILGVIHMPFFDYTIVAEKGKGAYLNGEKIHVSKRNKLNKALLQFDGSLALQHKRKISFISKMINKIFRLRVSGCAIWDLSTVAMGKADVCVLFSTKPWDIAAGFIIIEEAGGKITDFKGGKWSQYMKEFVASNKILHPKLLRYVNKL